MLDSLGRVSGLDISLGLSPVSPEEAPRGLRHVRLPKHEDSDEDDQYEKQIQHRDHHRGAGGLQELDVAYGTLGLEATQG